MMTASSRKKMAGGKSLLYTTKLLITPWFRRAKNVARVGISRATLRTDKGSVAVGKKGKVRFKTLPSSKIVRRVKLVRRRGK